MNQFYLSGSSFPDIFRFELEPPFNALSGLVNNSFDPSSVNLPRSSIPSNSPKSSSFSMDPISLGAAGLSGGLGLLGNLFNQNYQKKALQAQMAFSQQQQDSSQAFAAQQANQSMAFNAAQAQLSRDFSERMYNKSYADNSPLSQVRNLQAAGLNPDLLYSSIGSGQGISMSGSSATSSPPGAGVGGSLGLPSPMDFSAMSNAPLAAAQTRLLNSQADNLDSDTRGKDIDNFVADLSKGSMIEMNGIQVEISKYMRNIMKKDDQYYYQKVEQATATIKNLDESTRALHEQADVFTSQYWVNAQQLHLLETDNLIRGMELYMRAIDAQNYPYEKKLALGALAASIARDQSSARLNGVLAKLGLQDYDIKRLQQIFINSIVNYDNDNHIISQLVNTVGDGVKDLMPNFKRLFNDLVGSVKNTDNFIHEHPYIVGALLMGAAVPYLGDKFIEHRLQTVSPLLNFISK